MSIPFQLVFPDELHRKTKESAAREGVSMRVYVLQSVAQRQGIKYADSKVIEARGFHLQGSAKTIAAKNRKLTRKKQPKAKVRAGNNARA